LRGLRRLGHDLGVGHLKLGESLTQGLLGVAELGGAAIDEGTEAVYGDSGIGQVAPVELHSGDLREPHGRICDPVARRDPQNLVDSPLGLGLLLGSPQG
jgi:hypothetical protein